MLRCFSAAVKLPLTGHRQGHASSDFIDDRLCVLWLAEFIRDW